MHNMEQVEAILKDRFEESMTLSGYADTWDLKFDHFAEGNLKHTYTDLRTSNCYVAFVIGWVMSKAYLERDDDHWKLLMASLNSKEDWESE